MSSITNELAAALAAVDRPGDFYASGMTELHTPRLEVEGVGLVALPVLPIQVAQFVAAAERAPYGRGYPGRHNGASDLADRSGPRADQGQALGAHARSGFDTCRGRPWG